MPKHRTRSRADRDGIVGSATDGSTSFVEMLPLSALASLTIEEAINRTGFSRSRFYELFASGKLKSFRFGKRRFIDAQSLRDLIAELMAPNATPQGESSARSVRDESGSNARQPRLVLEDA